jgi:hypothetical protein
VGIDAEIKRRGSIMAAIFDLLYREYCRARLAEMRKQLLVSAEDREVPEANCDAKDSAGAADRSSGVDDSRIAGPGHTASSASAKTGRALFHQMKLPSFLALNASHRAIGLLHVGGSIQRYLENFPPILSK